MCAINQKNYVDEIFKDHYDHKAKNLEIVDGFLVEVKDPKTGQMVYQTNKEVEN